MIYILISVSPSNGRLERSSSKFSKTCHKDRNQILASNLETYIFSQYNSDIDYEKSIPSTCCIFIFVFCSFLRKEEFFAQFGLPKILKDILYESGFENVSYN